MHNAFSTILGLIAPFCLEDEYRRGFRQNAPKQPSFAEATRQAHKLLSAALNTH